MLAAAGEPVRALTRGPQAATVPAGATAVGGVGQPGSEARKEMAAAMPARYVDSFFRFFSDRMLDESTVLPTVAEITGRPPNTFRQWAATHAAAFR